MSLSKASGLVKKVGKRLEDYFLGIYIDGKNSGYLNCIDAIVGQTSMTILSSMGAYLTISNFFAETQDNRKYIFSIGTIAIIESSRYYFHKLIKKEREKQTF